MNIHFTAKFLQNLAKIRENKGFTLIELLVVVILLGVLAAISFPMLLGQIAKGRQAEAITALGILNRAQQAYRYEKSIFGKLADLPIEVKPTGTYYKFIDDGTPSTFYGAHKAEALPKYQDDIRNYAAASGQLPNGTYNAVVCEDETPTEDDVMTSNTAGLVSCDNGVKLE